MKSPARRRALWMRVRISMLAAILLAGAVAVLYRAWDLQIRRTESLRSMAEDQYLRHIRLTPRRGTIYDRNGAELAVSVDADSVWANPRSLRRAGVDPNQAAAQLGSVLNIDPASVASRLASDRYFVWIERQVTPKQAASVRALQIPGVSLLPEARRFYPNRELAGHILGYADVDGVGIDGLEMQLDERLRGSVETVPAIFDRRGEVVFSDQLLDNRAARGDDVYLTIDKTIQHAAERELGMAVATYEARGGSIVVLDPSTGELLALANYPTFNPNEPSAYPTSSRRNRAVTDRFEPGSTTKVFTVAGALSNGAIRPDQLIECGQPLQVADHAIHDAKKFTSLTPPQVLAFSSNIAAAKIGMAMGRESLFRSLRAFGFGEPTGIALPGETAGILRHYRRWYDMDAATIAFGQGMSVTAVQLAFAMAAIANHGLLMKPLLVKRIVEARGRGSEQNLPQARRQVIPAPVANTIADWLTGVTEEGGTAKEAAIDGFSVAGKTGTAQKADYVNGGYAQGKWVASFVGFVPARAPRVLVAVVIDEPWIAHLGGRVAAPLFRRVAQTVLRHLGVPAPGATGALAAARPRPGRAAPNAGAAAADAARQPGDKQDPRQPRPAPGESRVPNLLGLSARSALVAARAAKLSVKLEGTGVVVLQEPGPDETAPRGAELHLVLQPPTHGATEGSMSELAAGAGNREPQAGRGDRL